MKILKEHQKEYIKCLNDAQYFLKTYCKVIQKMITREILEGSAYEEIASIFLKYFTNDNQREYYSNHIRLIEKVTHEDGDIAFVLSFSGNRYDMSKASVDLEQVLPLLRKEKLEKLWLSLSEK